MSATTKAPAKRVVPVSDLADGGASARWRVGEALGRSIYAEVGDVAFAFLGLMDTPGLAERVVSDHNNLATRHD